VNSARFFTIVVVVIVVMESDSLPKRLKFLTLASAGLFTDGYINLCISLSMFQSFCACTVGVAEDEYSHAHARASLFPEQRQCRARASK
jgi:hypothetical protein